MYSEFQGIPRTDFENCITYVLFSGRSGDTTTERGYWFISRGVKSGSDYGYAFPPFHFQVGERKNQVFQTNWIIHEGGHWIQYKVYGGGYYYFVIIPSSVFSQGMDIATFGLWNHNMFWTETEANILGHAYFVNYLTSAQMNQFNSAPRYPK